MARVLSVEIVRLSLRLLGRLPANQLPRLHAKALSGVGFVHFLVEARASMRFPAGSLPYFVCPAGPHGKITLTSVRHSLGAQSSVKSVQIAGECNVGAQAIMASVTPKLI